MAIQSWLGLLSLVASATAWPQLPEGSSSNIPFAPRSLPTVEEIESMGTLHLIKPDSSKRQLPSVDDDIESLGTLHLIQPDSKRGLPTIADDGDAESMGTLHLIKPDSKKTRSPGALSLPVIHAPKPGLVGRDIEVQLENRSDIAYYAQLYMGNPPQEIYAQLDTGSSELWVNPDCSTLTSSGDKTFCQAVGQYDPSDSSTSKKSGGSRTLSYGVGSAEITYYADDIGLTEDAKLKGVQFGVADGGTEDQFAGVMGLSYGEGKNTKYPNILDQMKKQGIVETKAFSVALGSKAEGGGVAVFGGVDTGKFKGKLTGLPIMSAGESPDGVARYWVQLDSVSHSGKKKFDGSQMTVFLDTGATLTLLPEKLVAAIAQDLGADGGKDDAGFYPMDCSLADKDGTLDFAFDGVTVKVPYREVIREFNDGGSTSCYLGISSSDEYALLGDTFLRSAYVVFDLDSDTVWMAQYENCGDDVSTIKKSSDLKGLQGACGGSQDDDEEVETESTNDSSDKVTKKEKEQDDDDDEDENSEDDAEESSSESSSAPSSSTAETSSSATATATTTGGLPVLTEEPEPSQTSASKPKDSSADSEESENGQDDEDDSDNGAPALVSSWLSVSVSFVSVAFMAMW